VEDLDVGERGRNEPERGRHRLGSGLEQTAGGEECHRVFTGPQRKVGLRVTVMKGTLRVDEAGQEVPVEVFRFGHDANLSVPGSHLQGSLFLRRPELWRHESSMILSGGAGAEE
jgi:hypothetical protein